MGVYRFDVGKRIAGCKNPECKNSGTKIEKGELRFATMVTIKDNDSWQYKHWGCLTPRQIENLLESIGGIDAFHKDENILDGFTEVSEEFQDKIRAALERGNVPDEDWKGDLEMNVSGANGYKVKAKKKGAAKPAAKGRKRKANDEDDEAIDADKAPKRKRGPSKKKLDAEKAAKKDDVAEDEPAKPKKPAKKVAAAKKADPVDEPEAKPAPAKKEDVADEPEPKPKRAAAKKAAVTKKESSDEAPAPADKKTPATKKAAAVKKAPLAKKAAPKKAAPKTKAASPSPSPPASASASPAPVPAAAPAEANTKRSRTRKATRKAQGLD